MARPLSEYEADMLETLVKELLMKGRRKRTPFTPRTLDKAVAHGVGQINYLFGRCYQDEEDARVTKVRVEAHEYYRSKRGANDRFR